MAWHPFRNFGLKLTATVLGALLWFTVTGEVVERKILRVPIYYSGLPASLEITDQPDSVDVIVRGTYADISAIQDFAVTADLSGAVRGPYVLPLRIDQVNVPPDVEVLQLDPNVVTLHLDQSSLLDVPIEVTYGGEPAPGLAVLGVSVDPSTVTIAGPQGRLTPGTDAVTERVSVEGATSSITRVVTVGVVGSQLRLASPSRATVTIRIGPAPVTRTFEAVPLTFSNLADGLELVDPPEAVTVAVEGPRAEIEALADTAVFARVDLATLGPGQHEVDVTVVLPPGFAASSVTPRTVTVQVR